MTDRPIIFSAEMVKAMLDGRKTQTRRVLKTQPMASGYYDGKMRLEQVYHPDDTDPDCYARFSADAVGGGAITEETQKLRYATGDRLWVKEVWRPQMDPAIWACVEYRSDGARIKPNIVDENAGGNFGSACDAVDPDWRLHGVEPNVAKWRSPIFMNRWASRLTLTIKDVRVQRLHEISEADAQAEGIMQVGEGLFDYHEHAEIRFKTAKAAFCDLWNTIHGPDAWGANPWVSVIHFKPERGNIDEAKP